MNDKTYIYYSTQRPIDIGTTPRPPNSFLNFDHRMEVESGAFWAWGILIYKEPLTTEEMNDYELRPKREKPDIWPLMLRQAAHVGKWESRNNIPKERQLTYWKERTHCYLPRPGVTPERMEEQYWLATKYPKGPCHHRQKTPSPHFGER